MNVDGLFLGRCKQLEKLMQSHDELELLDVSAILRQMLADDHPLIHKANASRRIRIVFQVGMFKQPPDEFTTFQSLEDGVDPYTRPPGSPSKEVDINGLLRHEILIIRGTPQTIKDVIQFAANVAGGVHHTTNPKERQRLIAEYSAHFSLGGLPAGIRQLQAIARVFLRGVAPLIYTINTDGLMDR